MNDHVVSIFPYFLHLKKIPLRTGFPQLDAYAETRKIVSLECMENFDNAVKKEQSKPPSFVGSGGDLDAAARDVVRCLEHCLVIATGEKVCIVRESKCNDVIAFSQRNVSCYFF